MTVHNRIVADLHDVLSVRLVCSCGLALSFPPDKGVRVPIRCPSCLTDWPADPNSNSDANTMVELFKWIAQARALKGPITIGLELELPK